MATEIIDPIKILRKGHDLFFAKPPDYHGAAELFEKVVARKPDWVEGHGWLGSAYEKLGDEDRAAREQQIAHELDPTDTRPLISLGVLRTRQGRFDEAIKLIEEGIALKPHYCFADAKLFLADAFEGAEPNNSGGKYWCWSQCIRRAMSL
jgi:tetratricopeptide (TPR) repeat protein